MLQKLSFLLIIAILLTGCGAPAPAEADHVSTTEAPQVSDTATDLTQANESMEALPAEGAPETVAATSAVCNAEYFTFSTRTNNVTNEDDVTLLIENQTIPVFTSGDPERSAWVGEILAQIDRDYRTDSDNLDTYARDFVSESGTDYFYSYSNYQQMEITRHDEKVASLIVVSSIYSGGSHPNSVQVAHNLDIENRRILRLEDVILEDGAGELCSLIRAGVDEKFTMIDGGNGLFEDYGDTISNSMTYGNMTAYWYLNDVGLVVFYNQYELGPYAAGIIKVELPYEALEGILNPDYLPAEPAYTSGGLTIRSSADVPHRIPVILDPEGETLLIGAEGTVYQVQLSEVLWLEDTPISKQLLFSAKSLCENDVLELTGGYTDASRSFAIEYIDGTGARQLRYVHDGALTEAP